MVLKGYFVQRFLDGLQRKVRAYPCKIDLLLTIFEKMPPFYVLNLFRANSSLAQWFSALSFDARSQFQPFFVFEKLSLESDSSLFFSFSNISTTFQRLLPTDPVLIVTLFVFLRYHADFSLLCNDGWQAWTENITINSSFWHLTICLSSTKFF